MHQYRKLIISGVLSAMDIWVKDTHTGSADKIIYCHDNEELSASWRYIPIMEENVSIQMSQMT